MPMPMGSFVRKILVLVLVSTNVPPLLMAQFLEEGNMGRHLPRCKSHRKFPAGIRLIRDAALLKKGADH